MFEKKKRLFCKNLKITFKKSAINSHSRCYLEKLGCLLIKLYLNAYFTYYGQAIVCASIKRKKPVFSQEFGIFQIKSAGPQRRTDECVGSLVLIRKCLQYKI